MEITKVNRFCKGKNKMQEILLSRELKHFLDFSFLIF